MWSGFGSTSQPQNTLPFGSSQQSQAQQTTPFGGVVQSPGTGKLGPSYSLSWNDGFDGFYS